MLSPKRRWVLAQTGLGCAGLHCQFREFSRCLPLGLTSGMRYCMFAYIL